MIVAETECLLTQPDEIEPKGQSPEGTLFHRLKERRQRRTLSVGTEDMLARPRPDALALLDFLETPPERGTDFGEDPDPEPADGGPEKVLIVERKSRS